MITTGSGVAWPSRELFIGGCQWRGDIVGQKRCLGVLVVQFDDITVSYFQVIFVNRSLAWQDLPVVVLNSMRNTRYYLTCLSGQRGVVISIDSHLDC